MAKSNAGASPFDKDAELRRIERELERTSNMQSAFNHALVGGELEPHVSAGNLRVPVLLVHVSEDPIISVAAGYASTAAIKRAQFLPLDGRGHELLEKDVPAIADAILGHVGRKAAEGQL